MHYERLYCSRYFKDQVEIEKINVEIQFYSESLEELFPKISFVLKERGYPLSNLSIFDMCEELRDHEHNEMDAEYIKRKVLDEKSV